MLTGFSSMGVCGLSSGRPCPFALRVWQARADRWPPLSIPLQSNRVTGFSSAVDLATASQQSRLALGLLNRRVMKSSAAHMIIKALTLGGLSEPYLPPYLPFMQPKFDEDSHLLHSTLENHHCAASRELKLFGLRWLYF